MDKKNKEINGYFSKLRESNKMYSHGSNFYKKITDELRNNSNKIKHLIDLFEKYRSWREESEKLYSQSQMDEENAIKQLVSEFNKYKDYIADINGKYLKYSAQSKFESTVLEEFMCLLFMPLIRQKGEEQDYSIGNIRAYSNMYFSPKNFESFKEDPAIKINQKDQDFAIYRNITLTVKDESINISVPVVSMECKTYLDKTMLEGSIATAEKIKMGNPYCLFFIVTETYDVSYDVDPIYSRIDAIFVLRKQKRPRNGRLNPISYEVVYDLYSTVKKHLESDWSNIGEKITNYGRVI